MRLFLAASALLLVFIACGCVDVRYIGDVYAPTQNVRFFMNEKDLPANTYREMGIATVSIDDEDAAFRSGNVLSDALREKAMEVGADAIVIVSNERYKVGTRSSSSSNTFYSEREKGKVRRHHGHRHSKEKYKSKTHGYSDTFSSGRQYDIQRDEVKAKFLKLKSAN